MKPLFRIPPVNRYGNVAQQCRSKYRYATRKEARHYARLQRPARTWYRCGLCGGWHLKTRKDKA